MCTVTWRQESSGSCLLFFNRDEQKTRLPALSAKVESYDGIHYISARDGNCGGTCLFVNAFGLIAGLLNYYPEPLSPESRPLTSRGLLLLSYAAYPDPAALGQHIKQADLSAYRPFTLIALKPDWPIQRWQWDGCQLSSSGGSPLDQPITSSSYRSAEVESARRESYRQELKAACMAVPDEAFLARYHRQYTSGRGAYSVCMQREDAETKSITRIKVDPHQVHFNYTERIPESLLFREPVDLTSPRVPCPGR